MRLREAPVSTRKRRPVSLSLRCNSLPPVEAVFIIHRQAVSRQRAQPGAGSLAVMGSRPKLPMAEAKKKHSLRVVTFRQQGQ